MTEKKEEINEFAEEMVKRLEKDGWILSPHFEKKPFVDWKETEYISGLVGEPKIISSKFKDPDTGEYRQKIVAVGDEQVNCSGMLKDLDKLTGQEITIIRNTLEKSSAGKEYFTFHVMIKQK